MQASLKKNILIGIAVVAGLLLLAALGWFLYLNLQFNVYQDDQYKFSIKCPKAWKMHAHPKENVAIVLLRPKDTILDTIQENFNVTVQPLPNDIFTLPAFSARIKKQMTLTFGKSISITQDKKIQWGWREGHEMIFQAPTPDHLIMVNAWVLNNRKAYILTYVGDLNKYQQDSVLVEEIIRSLHLQ